MWTKQSLLEAIDTEASELESLVARAGAEGMERSGAAGDWTFKDVIAHLNGWRARTVDRLEAAARDEAPPAPAWPDTFNVETDEGTEQINQWLYDQARERPAAEIVGEMRDQFARMRSAVAAIPELDLLAPGRYSWMEGEPLGPGLVEGSIEHHHEEHGPALDAWFAKLDDER
jgi:hypothetical protein